MLLHNDNKQPLIVEPERLKELENKAKEIAIRDAQNGYESKHQQYVEWELDLIFNPVTQDIVDALNNIYNETYQQHLITK